MREPDSSVLESLRRLNAPTVSNAIEAFNVRPRNQGFMSPDIKCILPELGVMVGYAATARIMANQPAGETPTVSVEEYWASVLSVPEPRVVVIQDLDQPPAVGSLWGEVNANIHKALGCVGTVTNGGVRDLDEVAALGFQCFASAAIVSHAYVHLVDCGKPVEVGGLVVHPGDLIHADRHGVLLVPSAIADRVAEASAELDAAERDLIRYCQSAAFTVEGLSHQLSLLRERQAETNAKYRDG